MIPHLRRKIFFFPSPLAPVERHTDGLFTQGGARARRRRRSLVLRITKLFFFLLFGSPPPPPFSTASSFR